ncbi:MAG: V-type ATPase subunit [Oscillospiraceae bacterium]|nr:V-type ATPase subunit [Oscillospiraceae bacterium]
MAVNKITFGSNGRGGDQDYLSLASMIRMRSRELLTREQMDQLLRSESADAAAKQLQKAGWPNMVGLSAPEIDAALAERREARLREIGSVIADDGVVDTFRLKYDYHNAKALIKGEGAGVEAGDMISQSGRVAPAKLRAAFEGDDYRSIPGTLGHAMAEAKAVLARTQNPQLCDFILDKAYFAEMKELVTGIGAPADHLTPRVSSDTLDPFMVRYRNHLADSANLRIAVRCLRMGRDPEFMRTALIPEGGIASERIYQAAFGSDGLEALYVSSPFRAAAALGMEAVKGGAMTAFEKECDNALMRWLAAQRILFVGPELSVWYLNAEETGIVDVRMILTGMKAGIDPVRLKERLRDTYV